MVHIIDLRMMAPTSHVAAIHELPYIDYSL